jgi:hypothetical protein
MHGVNVKLEKTLGFRDSLRVLHAAALSDKAVWIGIMVGTNLLCNCSAQLIPFASTGYADVDGDLLVTQASTVFDGGIKWRQHGFLDGPWTQGWTGVGLGMKPNAEWLQKMNDV